MTVLSVRNLSVEFGIRRGLFRKGRVVRAVQDVSFEFGRRIWLWQVHHRPCGHALNRCARGQGSVWRP